TTSSRPVPPRRSGTWWAPTTTPRCHSAVATSASTCPAAPSSRCPPRSMTGSPSDRDRGGRMMDRPTLSRTVEDRVIAGVVGGIARRFGWNPTVLRIIYVVASVLSAAFPGILVYLVLWLLMPEGD